MSEATTAKKIIILQPFKCGFCGRQFSRKGTYGRHLDSKKGDPIHPAPQVEKIRASVIRRGPKCADGAAGAKSGPKLQKVGETPKSPETENENENEKKKYRKLKSEVSRIYNSKEDVKEKNKARRKQRDLRIKAQLAAYDWYMSTLSVAPEHENHDNVSENEAENGGAKYAFLVASHVAPSHWPAVGEFPGEPEFSSTVGQLTASSNLLLALSNGASVLEQAFAWHTQWQKLDPARKLALWQAESDRALRVHLHGASLYHISSAAECVEEKMHQMYEQYSEGDFFGMIFTDSEG